MKIAVITGASSGLGKEFAKQIEALKSCDELWLVARREERLNALADALMTKCRIFPVRPYRPEKRGRSCRGGKDVGRDGRVSGKRRRIR